MERQDRADEVAQTYFDRITNGRENAIKRPKIVSATESESNFIDIVDRRLRNMIERANHSGDCIIASGTGGYYRPRPFVLEEELEFKQYTAADRNRIRKLTEKLETMNITYNNWKKEADYADKQQGKG